jgi:glycosyltransferase involved in cell wall biosynthesis
MRKGQISLCMIVKNEANYLPECLKSVADIVNEIIVVDTGSIDNTKKIAESYGASVFDFTWVDDFSEARNYSLSKASGDWILYLDADERLDKNSKKELVELSFKKRKAGYFCKVVSPSASTGNPSVMKYIRFFRNLNKPRFTGKVHEQIKPSLTDNNFEILDSNITINHIGYDVNKDKLQNKAERNLNLLLKDFEQNPSSYNAFQIGQSYLFLNEHVKANKYFIKVLEKNDLDAEHMAQTYRYLAAYALSSGQLDKAEEFAKTGLRLKANSPLLNVVLANIYLEKRNFKGASEYAKKAFTFNSEFLNGKRKTGFEVLTENNNMILYGINVAIAAGDGKLFNFFYPMISEIKLSEKDKTRISFYNLIINGKNIHDNLLDKISSTEYQIIPDILLRALADKKNSYQFKIIKTFADNDNENYLLNLKAGELAEELGIESPAHYYERAYNQNKSDLVVVFKLLNYYLNEGNLKKLKTLLEDAVNRFKDNPELHNRFKSIYDKIK